MRLLGDAASELTFATAIGLPFGGIGPSGCECSVKHDVHVIIIYLTAGYLTGKYAFDTFSHLRGTLDNPGWVDTLLLKGRYPPYTVSVYHGSAETYQDVT